MANAADDRLRSVSSRARRAAGPQIQASSTPPAQETDGDCALLPTDDHPTSDQTPNQTPGRLVERWGFWSPDGRLLTEAFAISGRAVEVEFRLRADLVVVARGGSVQACFDRDVLASWLSELNVLGAGESVNELLCDEVTLSADSQGRIALSMNAGELGWAAIEKSPFSPRETAALYAGILG